jgi:hypothetical protein
MRLACLFVVAVASPAAADILKLSGEIHGGGMYGKGVGGDQKDAAFFAKSPHGTYGFLLNGEFLIFDAWIQHHQYFLGGDRLTTWTQFGLGIHFMIEGGEEKERKAHQNSYFEFGTGAWFGVGTGRQVMPPLDNAQVSDKGFLLEARFGFGKHLSSVFDFGVEVPVSGGYFFKSGNGAAANVLSTHYQGVQGEALLVLRANINLI